MKEDFFKDNTKNYKNFSLTELVILSQEDDIKALEERQCREMQILHDLNVKYMIADSPAEKQSDLYPAIIRELGNKT